MLLIVEPSLEPVKKKPPASDHIASTNRRARSTEPSHAALPVARYSWPKNDTQSMLCSVETLGIGTFAPLTPNRNPPSEPGFTALVVIQVAILIAPLR